jgi:hypothetical protein
MHKLLSFNQKRVQLALPLNKWRRHMQSRKEKSVETKEVTYVKGPYNPGLNGFVMLYHPDSLVRPFFQNVDSKTASSSAPMDIIHPYPNHSPLTQSS